MTSNQRITFESFDRVWFLTWTTYGTWLPGDKRGFVSPKFDQEMPEKRNNVVGTPYDANRPMLREITQSNLIGDPVYLKIEHAKNVQTQFEQTAAYRRWTIVIGAIVSNHIHLLVGVNGDPDPSSMLRDFKSYASGALNRQFTRPQSGTWWTQSGSMRKVKDARHFLAVLEYVKKQQGALMIWGRYLEE